jgi:hypothetical protein
MTGLMDRELARGYARALVAIARADDLVGGDEGVHLSQRIAALPGEPIALDDLLMEPPITPAQLAELAHGGGPFRSSGVNARDLVGRLVADATAILLAKGRRSEAVADLLWRFAAALGCTAEEFDALAAPWLPPIS